jgi:hypothetical protein
VNDRVVYAYGLLMRATRPSATAAPRGVPGAGPTRFVPAGDGLWLIAADVPREMYSASAIEQGMRDLHWVADRAVAHESVVEHFAKRGTVLPMKLFTLFASDQSAAAHLGRERARIRSALERIDGCVEWGVRVVAASRIAVTKGPVARSGTEFLSARKRARDEVRAAAGRAAAVAADVYPALSHLAKEARLTTPAEADAAGSRLLLDAAYLVPAAREARFKAAVSRLARRCAAAGCEMVLTGPWPAYNFIEPASGARDA